ncbi:MAG: hypothetical protein JOZ39_04445 [Chloroflexi bacterium]|nr:hypothetical protein [Chloroflexota bacterium]
MNLAAGLRHLGLALPALALLAACAPLSSSSPPPSGQTGPVFHAITDTTLAGESRRPAPTPPPLDTPAPLTVAPFATPTVIPTIQPYVAQAGPAAGPPERDPNQVEAAIIAAEKKQRQPIYSPSATPSGKR